jgi:hypothetical protein
LLGGFGQNRCLKRKILVDFLKKEFIMGSTIDDTIVLLFFGGDMPIN